jgi:hypothetical protein
MFGSSHSLFSLASLGGWFVTVAVTLPGQVVTRFASRTHAVRQHVVSIDGRE